MGIKEKRRSTWLVLAFLFCAQVSPDAAETNWSPNSDQIARLEKKLVLPPGTRPLRAYARYYWGTTEKGVKVIRGGLVLERQLGIHIVEQAPSVNPDQGCRAVSVWYEPARDKVSAQCSGVS
jgi:hypothetical protein